MTKSRYSKVFLTILFCLTFLLLFVSCGAPESGESGSGASENKPDASDGGGAGAETNDGAENLPTTPAWKEDGEMNVLGIGNSYTEDSFYFLYKMIEEAVDGSAEINLSFLYIGGCTLDMHAANARSDAAAYTYYQYDKSSDTWKATRNYKMSDALTERKWDFISIQQQSTSAGQPDRYTGLDDLLVYVLGLADENATLVWNMTWSYRDGYTGSDEFTALYGGSQLVMYEAVVSTVRKVIVPRGDFEVAPTGTAVQNARTSFLGSDLTRDGYHLSPTGRYVAALTYAGVLTGTDVTQISWRPAFISEEERIAAAEAVSNALKSPFSITRSER